MLHFPKGLFSFCTQTTPVAAARAGHHSGRTLAHGTGGRGVDSRSRTLPGTRGGVVQVHFWHGAVLGI